jgi:hypothetical protein
MSLGAYFGSTKITQGAGGLGQDGMLQAYSDGVVGGSAASADMPGPLFAFNDGALGQDNSLFAYADGVVGGSAVSSEMPGPLFAYADGSLGDDGAAADGPTPISVYRDGILGAHGVFGPGQPGQLQSFHDGSLGAAESTPGAVGATAVLDLGDAGTLTEVKALLGMLTAEQTGTMEGQKVYPPEFYTSGIWEPNATALWQYYVSKTPAFSGKTVSDAGGGQSWPNVQGVGYMMSVMLTPTADNPNGQKWVETNLPILWALLTQAMAAPPGAPPPTVLAPYLSLADKTRENRATAGGTMMMSTMAWYGVGAAALLGLALVLRKKKR